MSVHQIKVNRPYYQEIIDGTKTFEARLNDRQYSEGDTLELIERDPRTGRLTGRQTTRIITYTLHRAERWHPLSQIERYGLSILSLGTTDHYAKSSLNPHAAAGETPAGQDLTTTVSIRRLLETIFAGEQLAEAAEQHWDQDALDRVTARWKAAVAEIPNTAPDRTAELEQAIREHQQAILAAGTIPALSFTIQEQDILAHKHDADQQLWSHLK